MPAATEGKIADPKLAAMLELERRGELPDELKGQLQIYRQQGLTKPLSPTPPATPADNAFANDQVLNQIDKAHDLAANHWTTGWGDYLSPIPASPAHDLSSTVGTIRSNLSLDKLAQMRASSPTGAALGSVTEGEERLLADQAGALNQSDSQANFLDNLTAIQRGYGRLALKYKGIDPDGERGKALLADLFKPAVVPAPTSAGAPPPPAPGGPSASVPGGPEPGGSPPSSAPTTPVGTGDPSSQAIAVSPDGSSHYSTAENKAFAAEANAMLARPGSTRADMDAVAAKYGRGRFGPDLDRILSYRDRGGHFASVGTPVDGYQAPTLVGKAAASPAGAFVVGAADGLTAGHTGGITSAASGDPDAGAKMDAIEAAHRPAAFTGSLLGGTAAALGTEGALSALGVPTKVALGGFGLSARAALTDTIYGGVSGANGDHPVRGALEGILAGVGGGMAARQVGALVAPTAGRTATLYDAGVRPTVGQRFANSGRAGAALNMVEEASQSIPGLGMFPRAARQDARDQFERGAFDSALGELKGVPDVASKLPADMKLGTDPHAFMQEQFSKAYDKARSGMTFVPDKQYINDLHGYLSDLTNGVLNNGQVEQVRTILNRSVQSRLSAQGGRLTGDGYKQAASEVSAAAQKLSASEPLVAGALRDYATMFDNAARRNSAPEAVSILDKADAGYAKAVRIEMASAARGGDTGRFSPTQFDAAVQKSSGGVRSRAYLRGDALFGDYAEAGKTLVDKLPNSGTADRLMTKELLSGQAVTGGALATLGHFHPVSAALMGVPTLAYAPGVQRLTRAALAPSRRAAPVTLGDLIRNHGGALGGPLTIEAGQAAGLLPSSRP